MSVSGQLSFSICITLGALAQKEKPGYVQSVWLTWARNLFHVKGPQLICNGENDVESSHDFDACFFRGPYRYPAGLASDDG